MTIPASVDNYLTNTGVRYDVITHTRTATSSQSAQAAHIPGDRLAKCVLLQDHRGYLMAVLPATHQVDFDALYWRLGRELELAREREFADLFSDCEPGALPPLGAAYGFETILDEGLMDARDVYFEAGDHRALVHVSGSDFLKLMGDAQHADISRRH